MHLHVEPRPIYLCRCGETTSDIENILGGDYLLTEKGLDHAVALGDLFKQEIQDPKVRMTLIIFPLGCKGL